MPASTSIRIEGPATVWRLARKAQWVAYCDRLKLRVEGPTIPGLYAKIQLSLTEYFRLRLRMGDLPDILHENGWRSDTPLPEGISINEPSFDVPFVLGGGEATP